MAAAPQCEHDTETISYVPDRLYVGRLPRTVVVIEGDDERPLEHHVLHSPDGFNWGFAGSGSADLARCLLIDHLGWAPPPELYQLLHLEVVAVLAPGGWEITTNALSTWLASHLRHKDSVR